MAADLLKCATCGNHYDKIFTILIHEKAYNFDCFECAINKLAPICQNCGCRIIGHGTEMAEAFYCCAHCVRTAEANANAKVNLPPAKS